MWEVKEDLSASAGGLAVWLCWPRWGECEGLRRECEDEE